MLGRLSLRVLEALFTASLAVGGWLTRRRRRSRPTWRESQLGEAFRDDPHGMA